MCTWLIDFTGYLLQGKMSWRQCCLLLLQIFCCSCLAANAHAKKPCTTQPALVLDVVPCSSMYDLDRQACRAQRAQLCSQ